MDHMGSPPLHPADHSSHSTKRKRSLSNEPPTQPTPPVKVSKTQNHHLQINYLARQFSEILPLISAEHDSLPSLLALIGDYEGVLQRHESLAGNLGARPLGPILIQRFERLFDGPPRVLKMNGKENTSVGWLDVVEFARNKPEQFKLEQTREGVKVCQFYTKQCRVEISEEDFVLVRSGMPQKLIPPQPIAEDEEKELGTLEILEKAMAASVHLADQVAGRARQLNHKIRSRKNAIISRREAEASADEPVRSTVPSRGADTGHSRHTSNGERASNSPNGGGFVAVNRYADRAQQNGTPNEHPRSNGSAALHGASAATRAELLSKFHTTSDRSHSVSEGDRSRRTNSVSRPPAPTSKTHSRAYADSMEYAGVLLNTASPVPIPNTPSSLLPYVKPSPAERYDDNGPYKADMMARMEQLNRGDRVQPPCDRCRRLHMDCLKNLTACMGCTKKHAKCSWKDVEEQELRDHPFVPRVKSAEELAADGGSDGEGSKSGASRSGGEGSRKERKMTEVRDEELLGEDLGEEDVEMKDKPAYPSDSQQLLNNNESQAAADTSSSATYRMENQENATPNDSFPDSNLTRSRPESPQNPPYSAPQAQMHSRAADEMFEKPNSTDRIQTEYEKDLYSQLNEATRASSNTLITDDDPIKVYTAGSEPLEAPIPSPIPPMQLDAPTKDDEVNGSPDQQQLSLVVEANPVQTQRQEPTPQEFTPPVPVTHQERHPTPTPKAPQMPISPPLSGAPSHSTPTPNTPMLEQQITAQPMQT
ncbi:hypothetical protein ACLMJK_002283 [Lecanora helva]